MRALHFILELIIYFSSYSWSSFFTRFVRIVDFLAGWVFCRRWQEVNDGLDYLMFRCGVYRSCEALNAVIILSLRAGIDILEVCFSCIESFTRRDSRFSRVRRFYLLESLMLLCAYEYILLLFIIVILFSNFNLNFLLCTEEDSASTIRI